MERTANKSEWLELEAHWALFNSASQQLKQTLGFKMKDIGGVVCSTSAAEPSILINRCFVTRASATKELEIISAVKQFYTDAGVGEFFMHVPESDPESRRTLEKAGMKKSRGWMKFTRDLTPATARNADLDIREIGPEHAKDFARIVLPCFDMTDAFIPVIAAAISQPGFHFYMGFEGGAPAATGALYYKDGVAQCDWGSTHPDFRGRGFQGSLLARRINEAIEMGATNIYTATGEDVPGDPQHSYKNILRYGFTENYLRENWVPN